MQLRIMTEPQQGATYDDLLTLARETSRIRLGTLVTAATFRHPGMLAITVATVDAMSGGRVELGLGSGWFEAEHRSYGLPFPPLDERFGLLEEQLAIVTGLWSTPRGATFSFHGEHYTLTDSPAMPKPAQDRLPVIIGGVGPKRTPRLAATYAAEYNVPFRSLDVVAESFDRVRGACAEAGRDPATLVFSSAHTLAVGATEDEVRRRADAVGQSPEEVRASGLGGTVDEVVDKLGRLGGLGATRAYLQVLDLADLDHLRLVAEQVAPQL